MKSKVFILSLLSVIAITSCERLIEIDQPDVIEQEQAFDYYNSTRLSIIGLYGLMTDLVEPMFLAGEVRADLVTATKSAGIYIKEFNNNSFSASNPYISPKPYYTLINNANDFISEFGALLANQQMDSTDFLRFKSELVGIRVWSQYQLAKIYGKCKYYTEVLNPNNTTSVKVMEFGDELLQQLISDLTFSDTTIFTSQSEETIWKTIRFSDYYINTLLGELYMDIGEYEMAYDKFDEVTRRGDEDNRKEMGRFSIYDQLYGMDWMDELFDETWEPTKLLDNTVFMIAFDNKYNQTNELWNWTSSLDYQVAPAAWYIDQFEEHAHSFDYTMDYRYYSIINTDENIDRVYSINKYQEDDRPFIIERTGRIELLKAYCLNAQGKVSTALGRIKRVRDRLNLDEIDDSDEPDDDNEAMIWFEDILMDELAYENGFEGQRWFDLVRVAKRRNDPSYLADKVAQKYPPESQNEIREKLMDPKNWYLPVFE